MQNGIGPWHIVFYTTAVLLVLEFIVYTLMGSGVEQEWNQMDVPKDAEEEVELTDKKTEQNTEQNDIGET